MSDLQNDAQKMAATARSDLRGDIAKAPYTWCLACFIFGVVLTIVVSLVI